jgi:vitamin B12 transporter
MFLFMLFLASSIDSSRIFLDTLNFKRYISEGVVVTASRYEEDVSDISSSVSVITEEDIEFINSYTAPDLLSGVPGVEIMKTGNFGRADVVIRGIGNNGRRLGFLIDGRPEKMSIYGCAVTHTFPLHNVKRIEVVKGPLSSLYGSGAMGGVVNILTRQPGEENKLNFEADYGSFSTHNLTASFEESLSKLGFLGTVQRNSSDGHLRNSSSNTESYQGEIIYNFGKEWKIENYSRFVDTYNETPATLGDTSTPTGYQNYERGDFDISVYGVMSNIDFRTKLFRTFGYHEFSDGWESRDRTDGLSSSVGFSILEGNKTQGGIEFYKQYGEWISHGEWSRKVYEGFFHTEQRTSLVNLSGGLRYTLAENSAGILSYDGGMVFKLHDTRLRARIGKGFRLPSFSDLYLLPTSNDSLEPEELLDYEIGLIQKISNIADFDISLYHMSTDNFVRFSPASRQFENIDTLVEKGMEASIGIYPSDWIYFKVFYSYSDRGEKTQGVPGQKWSGNVTLERGILEGRLSGSYLTDYYAADNYSDAIPSYYVFDFRLNINLKNYLSVSLGIDNIFDEYYLRYVEIPGAQGLYRMPGRAFKVGVALRK